VDGLVSLGCLGVLFGWFRRQGSSNMALRTLGKMQCEKKKKFICMYVLKKIAHYVRVHRERACVCVCVCECVCRWVVGIS